MRLQTGCGWEASPGAAGLGRVCPEAPALLWGVDGGDGLSTVPGAGVGQAARERREDAGSMLLFPPKLQNGKFVALTPEQAGGGGSCRC